MNRWLVVGAGLSGATVAQQLAERGHRVTVVERKTYVGGTAADHVQPNGLLVQRFGPHVFHTSSEPIWNYVQRFAEWDETTYRVASSVDSRLVPLPLGFAGIDLLCERPGQVKDALLKRYGMGKRLSIHVLLREEQALLAAFARTALELVYRPYTRKHWGREPDDLDRSVLARVPIVVGEQESYHSSTYQAVPRGGFTAFVARMLDHPRINVMLESDFGVMREYFPEDRIVFTGAVDEFFGRAAGRLPYRTVRFETKIFDVEFAQSVATVNYPSTEPFTRVTEMKRITGQQHPQTALVYDFPDEYLPGDNEPLYPIPCNASKDAWSRYVPHMLATRVKFCGRLGEYRYYNMDQAIASAKRLVSQIES